VNSDAPTDGQYGHSAEEERERLKEILRERSRSHGVPPREGADSQSREREAGANEWTALVPIQPLGSRTPVFMIHAILGSVFPYHRLALALGTDRPVYGLQSRGLDGRQPPLETIPEMARAYLPAIRQVQPQGPYNLGGYSMGGWIAYEMAQQLRDVGEEVSLLAVLGTPAPMGRDSVGADAWRWATSYVHDYITLWRNAALADTPELRDTFFEQQQGAPHGHPGTGPFGFPGMGASGFPGMGASGFPGMGASGFPGMGASGFPGMGASGFPGMGASGFPGMGAPAGPGAGAHGSPFGPGMPQVGPTYKVAWTNAIAQLRYVAEPSDCRVDVFLTSEQTVLHGSDPTMGWGDLSTGEIGAYHVEGNHLNIFKEPQVLRLAEELVRLLDGGRPA
jgi:thioesterase domain-containing protein